MYETVGNLPERWRSLAAQLRTVAAAEGGARSLEHAAEELEATMRSELDRQLTLAEAAIESGYSQDHLGRLIREGRLPNVGRKGAPRLRRSDLPARAKTAAPARASRPEPSYISDRLFRDIVNSKRGSDASEER